jgi:lysyl-tRNA synthetase class 2
MRRMGRTSFAHIRDGSGEIQLYLNEQALGKSAYRNALDVLDVGDFVSAGGPLFRTRTGEPSVRVERLQVAAKALRPLPAKWHGLQDHETRFRQRYLDILANEKVRHRFEARTSIVSALRRVLDSHGFLEVETPTLQPVYGGGAAVPFVTSYAALNRDYYLRIADELYLKRLLVGGYERVYEICKNFRNEGIDSSHCPEFTMLECYQAFADVSDMRDLAQQLVAAAAEAACESTRVQFEDRVLDFTPPWRRVTYRDALLEAAGVDLEGDSGVSAFCDAASANKVEVDPTWPRAKLLDELMKSLVEPTFVQPTFLERYPAETSPLAKRCPDDPRYIERFEVFVNGMELANAYTELNDPLEQRARMKEQASARHGDDATPVDEDFLLALEHGMPPAGGLGLGVDRLVMALTGVSNIREVILFPQLRDRS